MLKKIIIIMILIISIAIYLPNKTIAMSNVIDSGKEFINLGKDEEPINKENLQNTSNDIYNILFTIAVVIAFAVGMVIGIQFMLASVDEKAKIKETLIPYVIGVFIIFAAFGIWKIVVNIGNEVTGVVHRRRRTNNRNTRSRKKFLN